MKLTPKITIGMVLVFTITLIVFAMLARQSGISMMEELSLVQGEMYSKLITSYLEHTMTEHAKEDSLSHFEHVFGLSGGNDGLAKIFLLNSEGQVAINLTGQEAFNGISKEVIASLKPDADSVTPVHLPNFKAAYLITKIKNNEACHQCHESADDIRGYLGVQTQINNLLTMAKSHSKNNYMSMFLVPLIMSAVLIVVMYLLVIKPIRGLDQQMHGITLEMENATEEWPELSNIKLPPNDDEIGSLAERINILLDKLNNSTRALKESHDEKILAADRLVTTAEMAASLAHEIKNPLAGVMGAIDIIYNKTPHDNEYKDTLAEVNRQLFRINHTLDDLLVFARPSKPTFALVDLNELMQSTLSILKSQPACDNIDFNYESSNEHQLINGDAKMLGQVLWNILTNAIQAMEHAGTLSIKLNQNERDIQLLVTDTGSGISAADMDSIFKSFFTTKAKGTGLGLAVTKQILDLHFAQINLDSVLGEGTTVTISFMRVDEARS